MVTYCKMWTRNTFVQEGLNSNITVEYSYKLIQLVKGITKQNLFKKLTRSKILH